MLPAWRQALQCKRRAVWSRVQNRICASGTNCDDDASRAKPLYQQKSAYRDQHIGGNPIDGSTRTLGRVGYHLASCILANFSATKGRVFKQCATKGRVLNPCGQLLPLPATPYPPPPPTYDLLYMKNVLVSGYVGPF